MERGKNGGASAWDGIYIYIYIYVERCTVDYINHTSACNFVHTAVTFVGAPGVGTAPHELAADLCYKAEIG